MRLSSHLPLLHCPLTAKVAQYVGVDRSITSAGQKDGFLVRDHPPSGCPEAGSLLFHPAEAVLQQDTAAVPTLSVFDLEL